MLQTITLFGQTINLYDFFNNISYPAMILLAFMIRHQVKDATTFAKLADMNRRKDKKETLLSRWGVAVLVWLCLLAVASYFNWLTGPMISKLFLGTRVENFFSSIFVAPFTIFLCAVILRISPLPALDITASTVAVSLVCFKIACFCDGCCNGIAMAGGIMNHNTGRKELPIQLVECACAVVMLVILIILIRKKERKKGLLYPLFILMYCGSRFVSEFWRDDFPNVWGPLKGYHIQCIIGFAEGLVLLAVVLIWGERIAAFFDRRNQAFLEKHAKKQQARSKKRK